MRRGARSAPYGLAFGHAAGDTDFDGDHDSTDSTAISGWNGNDPFVDVDLDGDVDNADDTAADADSLGWDVLSSDDVNSRYGNAGYTQDRDLATIAHMRYRVYKIDLGRWVTRDPAGYIDGVSLYQYTRSQSLRSLDPLGLGAQFSTTLATHCGGGGVDSTRCDPPPVLGPDPYDPSPGCQGAIDKFEQSDYYKSVVAEMARRGCSPPRILCIDCGLGPWNPEEGGLGGRTQCGPSGGIFICDNGRPAEMYEQTLAHELIHALDCCAWGLPGEGSCEQRICTEARAYARVDCIHLRGQHREFQRCVYNKTKANVCALDPECCGWWDKNPDEAFKIIRNCASSDLLDPPPLPNPLPDPPDPIGPFPLLSEDGDGSSSSD
ncbi:MAG: RHS repeat-associated core domain-containing protein [Phycisphaerales bacterium JB039]